MSAFAPQPAADIPSAPQAAGSDTWEAYSAVSDERTDVYGPLLGCKIVLLIPSFPHHFKNKQA